MTMKHVLLIGPELALKSPRALELKNTLIKSGQAKIYTVAQPEDLIKIGALKQKFDFLIFVAQGTHQPAYAVWKHFISKQKEFSAAVAIVSDRQLVSAVLALFEKPATLIGPEALPLFCNSLLQGTLGSPTKPSDAPANLTNRAETLSRTVMGNDEIADPHVNEEVYATNPMDELVAGLDDEVSKIAIAGSDHKQDSAFDDLLASNGDVSHPLQQAEKQNIKLPSKTALPQSQLETVVAPKRPQLPTPKAAPVFEREFTGAFEGEQKSVAEELSEEALQALSHSDAPIDGVELEAPVAEGSDNFDVNSPTESRILHPDAAAELVNQEFDDLLEVPEADGLVEEESPREEVSHREDDFQHEEDDIKTKMLPSSNHSESLNLPGINPEASEKIDFNKVVDEGISLLKNSSLHSLNQGEIETLKRYAALKERESRERDATIQVLNKQLLQLKDKLTRSESERRRLQVTFDETMVSVRALEDSRDQHQNQLKKLESQNAERQKTTQLKLDNAQFMATRAEKKLEEFRNRVRSDILRIRLRERELSNKLELQKRDAEALLSSKDERLLEQKREIDRLEYEMELLKERMIEDTEKAEERAAKLSRALQSLKMAQGVLSGIEEEVIPTTQAPSDDDNQAA